VSVFGSNLNAVQNPLLTVSVRGKRHQFHDVRDVALITFFLFIVVLSPAINRWRHYVFGLPMRPSVCGHMLNVCEPDILETACGNVTRFTS